MKLPKKTPPISLHSDYIFRYVDGKLERVHYLDCGREHRLLGVNFQYANAPVVAIAQSICSGGS